MSTSRSRPSRRLPDVVFSIAIYDSEGSLIFQTDTEILDVHFDAQGGKRAHRLLASSRFPSWTGRSS